MFPLKVTSYPFAQSSIQGLNQKSVGITIYGGVTLLVGSNASGKTLLLKGMKGSFPQFGNKKVKYISAGRISPIEPYRSSQDGHHHQQDWQTIERRARLGDQDAVNRRYGNETVLGDFQTLSVRTDIQIKVAERLRKLFRRDLIINWDAGFLKLQFSDLAASTTRYSSAFEASGLLHLTAILTALFDDEIGVLLLDEPEVSLHPQLKSFLLREIQKVAGDPNEINKKLIIIATHSTEMLDIRKPEDLPNMVFCYGIHEDPVQISPVADELKGKKVKELLARLGQEHKLAFFSKRPLLVEGPSDQIICSGLDRELELYMEAAGAQFLPVIGKGEIPNVVKLMRMIGKSPIVLADADAIADGLDLIQVFTNENSAKLAANDKGHKDANRFASEVYSDFCRLVQEKWINISPYAERHSYWVSRDIAKDELIAKRRAAFSTLMSLTDAEISALDNSSDWISIRKRLESLLDFLEKAGCFILRKGTIESYYHFAGKTSSEGKPAMAVEEIIGLLEKDKGFINNQYDDIVRCLKYTSSIEPIDEARALQEMVLAVAAPALSRLEDETANDASLQALITQLLGDKASLFTVSKEVNTNGLPRLVINVKSSVLDVDCFPITLSLGDNPNVEVPKQMKLT